MGKRATIWWALPLPPLQPSEQVQAAAAAAAATTAPMAKQGTHSSPGPSYASQTRSAHRHDFGQVGAGPEQGGGGWRRCLAPLHLCLPQTVYGSGGEDGGEELLYTGGDYFSDAGSPSVWAHSPDGMWVRKPAGLVGNKRVPLEPLPDGWVEVPDPSSGGEVYLASGERSHNVDAAHGRTEAVWCGR